MTILLARLRQATRWVVSILAVLGTVVAARYLLVRRKRDPQTTRDVIDDAFAKHQRQAMTADAEAVVKIAAGRERAGAERDVLIDALRDTDEDRRSDRLIEQARRLREK